MPLMCCILLKQKRQIRKQIKEDQKFMEQQQRLEQQSKWIKAQREKRLTPQDKNQVPKKHKIEPLKTAEIDYCEFEQHQSEILKGRSNRVEPQQQPENEPVIIYKDDPERELQIAQLKLQLNQLQRQIFTHQVLSPQIASDFNRLQQQFKVLSPDTLSPPVNNFNNNNFDNINSTTNQPDLAQEPQLPHSPAPLQNSSSAPVFYNSPFKQFQQKQNEKEKYEKTFEEALNEKHLRSEVPVPRVIRDKVKRVGML
ncbi:Hypothetical_protein [Hexamita inflata]|uniref:Hypothetical_protein n=1 Tax=Hexamita inflata TaxID=28002 RepID=A0AA86RJJ9_9EUKA|nr:Hypothetical protein HINF_LOCUS60909 [Hexamita inflata]